MGLFKTKSPTQAQINQADALLETELTIDLQLRMNATCSKICNDTIHERKSVDDKKENEKYLNQAEQRCLDVCTWKYMTAQKSTLAYVNEEIKNNMSAKGLNMEEEVRKHAKAMGKVEQNLKKIHLKKSKMDALNQMSEESQAKYLESIQKIEFEGINDEFQNLTKSCKTKCLDTTFNNPKLYKGEMVCLDKCASKYIEFKFKMQEIMTKHMEEKQKFLMSQMEMTEAYLEQKSKVL